MHVYDRDKYSVFWNFYIIQKNTKIILKWVDDNIQVHSHKFNFEGILYYLYISQIPFTHSLTHSLLHLKN